MSTVNKLKKFRYFFLLCAVAVMAVIFMFSAQPSVQSTNTSDSVTIMLAKIFVRNYKSMTDYERYEIVHTLNVFVRKGAHFSVYAFLSVFVTLFFLSYEKLKLRNVFLHTILFCMTYASTDELHQYFVPGRSCQVTDVMIDTCGAIAGFVVVLFIINVLRHCLKFCKIRGLCQHL